MIWKEIRNGEPDSHNIMLSGNCKIFEKKAEVTTFFRGTVECKTDLQKTNRFKGYKCSQQEEKGHQNPDCVNVCPLIQKDYL